MTQETKGLIYVFTGDGKGKTSAALGTAVRALLRGERVDWIAFYKQESWGLAEAKLREAFPKLTMVFGGKGFRIPAKANITTPKQSTKVKIAKIAGGAVVADTASEMDHRAAAESCLRQMQAMLKEKPFLLVADESINAVSEGLIKLEDLWRVLAERGETHIILTGRGGEVAKPLIEEADLVTECRKVKHPYDQGRLAVSGLDF